MQFATEFTSFAAPRTVLHAAAASAAHISPMVTIFCVMDSSSTYVEIERGVMKTAPSSRLESNGYRRGNVRVRLVVFELEILGFVIEQALSAILDD